MPRRTAQTPSSFEPDAGGESLVDWREPERNAHVLDWRERAHGFGLVPVEDHGAIDEPIVEPADRLLQEEETEAFEDQHLENAERDALRSDEVDEAPEARLPHEEIDLVRVYLRHIGKRKLLKAKDEQESGLRIEQAAASENGASTP